MVMVVLVMVGGRIHQRGGGGAWVVVMVLVLMLLWLVSGACCFILIGCLLVMMVVVAVMVVLRCGWLVSCACFCFSFFLVFSGMVFFFLPPNMYIMYQDMNLPHRRDPVSQAALTLHDGGELEEERPLDERLAQAQVVQEHCPGGGGGSGRQGGGRGVNV